jgi:acyl-CoA reductase-like NAD-dependent aldehyde dehydrogenase
MTVRTFSGITATAATTTARSIPMTDKTDQSQSRTAVTDELLGQRPVWGPFISGSFIDPKDVPQFPVHEPANGRPLVYIATADTATVDRAVRDSRTAYEAGWRDLSPRERGGLLREVGAVIREHADELAEITAREVGKPMRDARRNDIVSCYTNFDYYGSIADTLRGEIIDQGPIEARINYEPYGVVAAILPFNWPPIHFAKKCAPALAAGNTVVVKPGEQAPWAVLRLTELANQVLPAGVINAVTGIEAGAALSSHPVVERITFTGATATGQKVLESAAKNVTYATMELGGKNSLLVLDDADLEAAVTLAIEGMFYNQGEACTSTSRILVHSSRYDDFTRLFVEQAAQLTVGDPLDPKTDIGPMVDGRQRDRVLGYLETGIKEGAELLYHGEAPQAAELSEGFFVPPAVLGGVTAGMAVEQEEIFGPVASLLRFDTDDEAVRIANDTAYGLTAAICTRDESRAYALSRRLEVGMVFVNNYTRRSFIGSPFGGVKGSGFGREYAQETLHEFVRAKNVRFPSRRGEIPTWPPRS